ncbi:DNA repair protein RadA, partial [Escherichia coli]|nr:DNA repair protein RadA [Escherichia coli]
MVDSIQTMNLTELSSSPGSVTQVRECINLLMRTAKSLEIPIIIVGHVNKDGAIAGPKVLEHIVDAVLY